MSIKNQIEKDLKQAMLAGDKTLVTTLRGIKSTILYAEVSENARDSGLADDKIITILQKEAKKRQESADLYGKGGNLEKQEAELAEKEIINQYLPEQLSEVEIVKLVDASINKVGKDQQKMGQIIGMVKSESGGNADGALVAKIVKERLSQ